MIELRAKENAKIEIINGEFSLGNRNIAVVHIEDSLINEQLKLINTGNCKSEYNMYPYGDFENEDLVEQNLTTEFCDADLVEGKGYEFSTCLYCHDNNISENIGTVKLNTVNNLKLITGTKYVFSCYIKPVSGCINLIIDNKDIIINENTNDWILVRKEFIAESESAELCIQIQNSECYIDNIKLFQAEYEILNSDSKIEVEINILNPHNNVKINNIVNWCIDTDNNVCVILALPPITIVDFSDNILCEFIINQILPEKISYLNNMVYYKVENNIYKSEPFVLNGYMIPTNSKSSLTWRYF